MSTRMPWPTARRAVPMAAVVLPFPGPVFTMMRPRRTSCIGGVCDCTLFWRGTRWRGVRASPFVIGEGCRLSRRCRRGRPFESLRSLRAGSRPCGTKGCLGASHEIFFDQQLRNNAQGIHFFLHPDQFLLFHAKLLPTIIHGESSNMTSNDAGRTVNPAVLAQNVTKVQACAAKWPSHVRNG